MRCELAGLDFSTVEEEERLAAARDVEIRRARVDDEPAVMEFLGRHLAGWQYEVGQMFRNRPISLHLAILAQAEPALAEQPKSASPISRRNLPSAGLLSFAGIDGNNRGTGWFGPMGSDPECRGWGLGRVLLRRCLQDFQAQARDHCTIPWVGPYGFYARHCGARIDRVLWRYEKA